jgi:hypothetical protein
VRLTYLVDLFHRLSAITIANAYSNSTFSETRVGSQIFSSSIYEREDIFTEAILAIHNFGDTDKSMLFNNRATKLQNRHRNVDHLTIGLIIYICV